MCNCQWIAVIPNLCLLIFTFYQLKSLQKLWKMLLPSKHLLVLKTSSARLQRNKTSCKGVLKTFWRHLTRRLEDMSRRFGRRFGRWKIVTLKKSSRRLEDMSWRRLGDKQNVYWRYLYLTNLNVYITNLDFSSLYLTYI